MSRRSFTPRAELGAAQARARNVLSSQLERERRPFEARLAAADGR
jgi:hypothetical protein